MWEGKSVPKVQSTPNLAPSRLSVLTPLCSPLSLGIPGTQNCFPSPTLAMSYLCAFLLLVQLSGIPLPSPWQLLQASAQRPFLGVHPGHSGSANAFPLRPVLRHSKAAATLSCAQAPHQALCSSRAEASWSVYSVYLRGSTVPGTVLSTYWLGDGWKDGGTAGWTLSKRSEVNFQRVSQMLVIHLLFFSVFLTRQRAVGAETMSFSLSASQGRGRYPIHVGSTISE